jgi:hypothetical protein
MMCLLPDRSPTQGAWNAARRTPRASFATAFRPEHRDSSAGGAALMAVTGCLALLLTPPAAGAEIERRWLELYDRQAGEFSIAVEGESTNAVRIDQPLLTYTNPVRTGSQHGAVWVWTSGGRPACLGSIWSSDDRLDPALRRIHHECHSLATRSLVCEWNGRTMWTSGAPGLAWLKLEGAEPPSSNAAVRLAQMRHIAQSLQPSISSGESELRLLSQPLYRYPDNTPNVLDGAIFAWVMGTDPEVFLLLEAASPAQDWKMAFARFTHQPVQVAREGRTIWECGPATPYQRTGPYYLMWKADSVPNAAAPPDAPSPVAP